MGRGMRTLKQAMGIHIEKLAPVDLNLDRAYQNVTFSFLEDSNFTYRLPEAMHKKLIIMKNRFLQDIFHEMSKGKKPFAVKAIPEIIHKICLANSNAPIAKMAAFTLYISPNAIGYVHNGKKIISDISTTVYAALVKLYHDFCELISQMLRIDALRRLEKYCQKRQPIEDLYIRLSAQKKFSIATRLTQKDQQRAFLECFTEAELEYITTTVKDPTSKLGRIIRKNYYERMFPKLQPENSYFSTENRQSAAAAILTAIKIKKLDQVKFNRNQLDVLQEKNGKLALILEDFATAGGQLPQAIKPMVNRQQLHATESILHNYSAERQKNLGLGILDFCYKLCFLTRKTAAVKISASAKLSVAISAIKKGHQFNGFFKQAEIGALTEEGSTLAKRVYNYIKAGGKLPKQLNETPAMSRLVQYVHNASGATHS